MFRKLFLTAAVAVAVGVLSPSAARADFILKLSDGTNTSTVDLTTGTTLTGTATASGLFGAHLAVFTVTFDNYSITSQVASNNLPGSATDGKLSVSNTLVTNNNATTGNLTISVTASGYSGPTPQASLNGVYSGSYIVGADSGSKVQEAAYYGASGTDFDTSGPVVQSTNAFTNSGVGTVGLGNATNNPYSLTDVITLTGIAAGGNNSLNTAGMSADVMNAPAPSGLILAATVVPFFGLLRRRMRQMNSVVIA